MKAHCQASNQGYVHSTCNSPAHWRYVGTDQFAIVLCNDHAQKLRELHKSTPDAPMGDLRILDLGYWL